MRKHLMVLVLLALCFCAGAMDIDRSDISKPLDIEDPAFEACRNAFSEVSIVGSFSQTKGVSGSSRQFTSTGSVQIAPGYGIVWLTEKPYASRMVVGRDRLVQQIRNNDPVRMEVADNLVYVEIAQAMECVFFGDFDVMMKAFDAYFLSDGTTWYIRLVPADANLAMFMDHIVMKGSDSIDALLMVQNSGDYVLYEFSDMVKRSLTDEETSYYFL